MSRRDRSLVYSSDGGRQDAGCAVCGRVGDQCTCAAPPPPKAGSSNVRVGRETKGRKGKGVSVISGLPLAAAELADLARELKNHCGAGGTVRDGVIEIQGDHRDRLVLLLQARGYVVKRAGG